MKPLADNNNNMQPVSKPRLEWVDYAKGICIFAVVSMYSAMFAYEFLGDAGWLQSWADFARPFRMPDFFLLSGLFLGRVINKSWRGYLDKKIIHYSYFFLLWTFINLIILYAVGTLHGGFKDFAYELWLKSSSWPWMMLWFIQMLPAYFLITRLTVRVPVWIMLVVASLLQAFPQIMESVVHAVPPLDADRVLIDEFWKRYIFFYVGYIGAPYFFKFAEIVKDNVKLALVGLVIWATLNSTLVQMGLSEKPFVGLFLGLAGASAVITLGTIASKFHAARWLRYLGTHSIVVYLAFYWMTRLTATLLLKIPLFADYPATFGAIATIVGIFGSVVLYWLVRGSPYTNWLFDRPKWLHFGDYETKPAVAKVKA